MHCKISKGIYRHYKGKDYQVIDFPIDSATDEKMVLYKPLYDIPELGPNPLFVQTIERFTEIISWNGQDTPRFTLK